MPQHVRTSLLQRNNPRQILSHQQIHHTRIHCLSFLTDKKRFALCMAIFVSCRKINLQNIFQFLAKRNHALLIPLSRHFNRACREIHICVFQTYQFREPDARFVENSYNRLIPDTFKISPAFSVKQPVHIGLFHEYRQRFLLFRTCHLPDRIYRNHLLAQQITIKRTQRTQLPVYRRSGIPFIHQ